MKRFVVGLVVVLALPSVAFAEWGDPSASGCYRSWSVLTGRTVGGGQSVLDIEAGYPGISVSYLHGLSSRVDIGGAFTFNYGLEGTTIIFPGIKPQFLLKFGLLDTGKVNLALTFSPALLMYFGNGVVFGMAIPVGLNLGFPLMDSLNVAASFDLPVWISFSDGVAVPILFGGGLEYFLDRSMALTFKLKLGPTVGFVGPSFTVIAQMGLAIKL